MHKKLHDPSRPYPCDLCSYRFRYPSDLKRHIERCQNGKKTKESPTLNDIEKRKVSEIYNHTKESVEVENESVLNNKKVRIEICNVLTDRIVKESGIVIDNENVKPPEKYGDTKDSGDVDCNPGFNVKKVRIDVCNVHNESMNLLQNKGNNKETGDMKQKEHETIKEPIKNDKELLNYQNESLKHLSTSEAAMINISSLRNFTCPVCNKTFCNAYLLGEHRNKEHARIKFTCDDCNKVFLKESTFLMHKKLHDHLRKNPCDICGLRYIKKSDLSRHKAAVHKVSIYTLQLDKSRALQFSTQKSTDQQRIENGNKVQSKEQEIITIEDEDQTVLSSTRTINESLLPAIATQTNSVVLPNMVPAGSVKLSQFNVITTQPHQNIVTYQQQKKAAQIQKSYRPILPKQLHISDVRSEGLEHLLGNINQQQASNPTQNVNLPSRDTNPQQLTLNNYKTNSLSTPGNIVDNQPVQQVDLTGSNENYFQCHLCYMAYKTKAKLDRHLMDRHNFWEAGTTTVNKVGIVELFII